MGPAGLRLSRSKTLFFSGALLISLTIIVHVFSRLPAGPALTPRHCSRSAATCRFRTIPGRGALDILNGTWILAAGDSQSRLLVLSLLRLLLDPSAFDSAKSDLSRRHSDYHTQIADAGVRLDFIWSPFESNISSSLRSLTDRPDVVVAGSGLWHMLHVTNPTDYGEKLGEIKEIVRKGGVFTSSRMFWIGLPWLVEGKLNTEEKRARMNSTMQGRYNAEVERAGILRAGGGPFVLLDVGALSRRCGARCTADGMHYDGAVYDAAVQAMLNALLAEARRRG